MILLLDNYDSFTYNLYHYLEQMTDEPVEVHRNDQISLEEVSRFSAIVLSPGPGLPSNAGIMSRLIHTYASQKPILGICLGHQAIGEVYGAALKQLPEVLHGVESNTHIREPHHTLFKDISSPFKSGHYHSWVIDNNNLPGDLVITAEDAYGNIMGIAHRNNPVLGLQFHPESIMTPCGMQIMKNWISTLPSRSQG